MVHVSFIVVLLLFTALNSMVDKDRNIPPATTKEGKRARVLIILMVLASIATILSSILAKKPGGGVGINSNAIVPVVIGIIYYLIYLFISRKKDK